MNENPAPTLRRSRRWPSFLAGLVCGVALVVGVAIYYGPKSSASLEDPITGRRKVESSRLGILLTERIDENEVSKWADQNGKPELYPGRCGWTTLSYSDRPWFSYESIACRTHSGIPAGIFYGKIKIEGLT